MLRDEVAIDRAVDTEGARPLLIQPPPADRRFLPRPEV